MSPLVWTLAPLVATLVVACWLGWRARRSRSVTPADTVAAHERYRSALARSRVRVTGSGH